MKKGDTSHTAAEIRSLADEAEAEAAEAEALAAAARARARAIKLRREAQLAEAKKPVEEDISDEPADGEDTLEADAGEAEGAEEPEDAEAAADSESDGTQAIAEAAEVDSRETAVSESGRRRPRRPKLSSVAAVLAVVISLVAVGASVEMAVLHKHAVRERQQVAEYAAAARQGVVTLTSLDFEHAKEGVQRIVEVSTGTFKDDFLKMADDFTNVVEQSKVVSQGSVQAAAVDLDSMTDNSAVVLVASTSEVTNAAGAKQDPRKYRLIVTMTRDGGQLKMSKVEFVP
ncbi:MAG: hypothetical protein CK429_26130 [Mycobacterium sp.]|uniref:hypothetical protein n=1 Tax=Mycobacterium gordonae TaxID=1778 RepID=UPI000CB9EEEC|nr:hypothetical protein [Mycobacterium gordonae]MCQ4360756.1 hypothetical protein [Mycobacterium gordonae]PJE07133.1 MAG: hypothetical protein CK429_26130 [Mycobacterium sp.]